MFSQHLDYPAVGQKPHSCCPASWESTIPHSTSPGKGPNSKFEVWFLLNLHHFCTIIKLKNHELNHLKSGTICFVDDVINQLFGSTHNLTQLEKKQIKVQPRIYRKSLYIFTNLVSFKLYQNWILPPRLN